MPSDVRFSREAFENLESPFLDENIIPRGDDGQTEADVPLEVWSAAEDAVEAEEAGETDQAGMAIEEAFEPIASEAVEEEVIGRDTRVRVANTLQVPNRWICAFDVMSENPKWGTSNQPRLICKSRATGTLIGPKHVLTAAHVFGASATASPALPTEHTVSPARNGDNSRHPLGKSKSASIRVARPYRIQQQLRVEGRLINAPVMVWDDYALVILDTDVASTTHSKLKGSLEYWGQNPQVAVVKRLDRGDLEKKQVVVVGYPGDACGNQILSGSSSEKASKANKCWFNRNDEWASTQWRSEGELTVNAPGTLVFHDADTYQGQSGAPICLKVGGVLHLVAIHTAPHSAQHNKGVPVTLRMLRDLCDWINADAGYEAAIVQNDTLSFQPAPKAGAKELPLDVTSEVYAPLADEWWRGPSSAEAPPDSSACEATYELEQPPGLYEPEVATDTEVLDPESFERPADEAEEGDPEEQDFLETSAGQSDDFEAGAADKIVFPNGESLTILAGLPVANGEEYWDPTGSGNPLLDTGPVHKDKKLSKSFTVRELTTSGGVSADVARIDPKLVEALQRLHDQVGKTVKITSGFRSWKRNKQVYERRKKQPTRSQHCGGRAADISIKGMNGLEIARAAIDACGPDIGVGLGKTFAHIDVRGVATVWDYGSAPDPWVADVKRHQKSKGGRSTPAPPVPERRGPPLAPPSGEIVRFAQRVLNATEGERLNDDGDLGPLTRGALERFRKRYGLGTTGVIDAKTEIALAQRALEEIAQQSMFPQAGVLDAKTRNALTAFKAGRGLAVGPTLDAATRQALTEALAKRAWLSVPRSSGSSAAARPSTPKDASVDVKHIPFTGRIQGLEKGVKVSTTMSFRPDVSDRRDLVIAATGAAEGGFDTVNMYDRGILSWGMMQWTLHAGSLQKALSFIKERLTAQGNSSLWSRLFGGLDLRDNEIVYQGELVTTKNNSRLREIFRGSAKPNEYDRTTAEHWARTFARAGRDAVIQALQTAYARKEVDALLEVRLGAVLAALRRRCSKRPEGGTWKYVCPKLTEGPEVYVKRYRRVGDYVGTVLKTLALVFGMKINNPAGAYTHLMLAVDALAAKHSTHDIEVWPAGWQVALGDELERLLRASGFAMWGDAKAKRAGRLSRTTKILDQLKKQTRTV